MQERHPKYTETVMFVTILVMIINNRHVHMVVFTNVGGRGPCMGTASIGASTSRRLSALITAKVLTLIPCH
jgi:hypothetical protein